MLRHDHYVTRLARQAHLQVEECKLQEEKFCTEEAEKRHCDKQDKKAERLRQTEEKIKCELEEKRQSKASVVQQLKCKEKEQHFRKEARISELEGAINTLQEKRAALELARQATDDELQQVGREIVLAESEKSNLKGELNRFEESPIYLTTVSHAEQQTEESAMQIAKENAALKEQITYLTCRIKMI